MASNSFDQLLAISVSLILFGTLPVKLIDSKEFALFQMPNLHTQCASHSTDRIAKSCTGYWGSHPTCNVEFEMRGIKSD